MHCFYAGKGMLTLLNSITLPVSLMIWGEKSIGDLKKKKLPV
jgi:hypothetical protein